MIHAEFKVLGGKHQGRSIPINTKKFLVGREQDCHLRPNNDLVSRHHCVFIVDDFAVRLRDLGSTNGTRVNDELVRGERVLQDGDRIAIGKLELEIVIGKRAAVAAPVKPVAAAVGDASSGLSGVLAVAPEMPDESAAPTDSTIEVAATETQTAGASGETSFEIPVYPGALETAPAGSLPGDTAILGGMQPGMMPGQMMPGYGAPMGMPGYPMMPGYGAPMGYPGYGGYPQPGYPMQMGYPMAPQMPGYPMMPQGYPGMPAAQPEAAQASAAAAAAPVKLPDPETTGVKEAPPAPPPAAGAPPAAASSGMPSNTAADIIKNYMQRRTGR